MTWFHVTKYNPALRGSTGFYSGEDSWTSFGDIGKMFGGKRLTRQSYLEVENDYIRFYSDLLETLSIRELRLAEVEIYDEEGNKWLHKSDVSLNEIKQILRDILREHLWGKLIGERGFEIHFGYDLYTYFGAEGYFDSVGNGRSVFVERIEVSPYCSG